MPEWNPSGLPSSQFRSPDACRNRKRRRSLNCLEIRKNRRPGKFGTSPAAIHPEENVERGGVGGGTVAYVKYTFAPLLHSPRACVAFGNSMNVSCSLPKLNAISQELPNPACAYRQNVTSQSPHGRSSSTATRAVFPFIYPTMSAQAVIGGAFAAITAAAIYSHFSQPQEGVCRPRHTPAPALRF